MRVKMHKIEGGKALRTDVVEGTINIYKANESRLPEVGETPYIFGESLTKGANNRIVNTSPIVAYKDVGGGRQVTTRSGSVYFFEVVEA